jgi:hypothetical protein
MSCADVCLDHDYQDDNVCYRDRVVTARKTHKCCECGTEIPRGARYELAEGKSDVFWAEKTCLPCREIREAFVCGSFEFGRLWESIEEEMFPVWDTRGPIDCLAKLDSLDARELARAKYQEWVQP